MPRYNEWVAYGIIAAAMAIEVAFKIWVTPLYAILVFSTLVLMSFWRNDTEIRYYKPCDKCNGSGLLPSNDGHFEGVKSDGVSTRKQQREQRRQRRIQQEQWIEEAEQREAERRQEAAQETPRTDL